ncbi:MAG: cysteine synthase A [Candidatus Methanomethylophilaceae archaeon]
MAVYDSILECIGETPIVRLGKVVPPGSEVYVKIERGNPGGSVKDRAAASMISDAEARGLLGKGGVIVEPTSGNTGIALCMTAAAKGYRTVIVIPDTMSEERMAYMRAYGAEIVMTPGAEGMRGAVDRAERIAKETGAFLPGQFDNPANTVAHRVGTGREILRDLPGVDYVFSGIGTGATATGIAQAIADAGSHAKVVGVEPAESPLLTEGRAGPHGIQGIGANFVPGCLDESIISEIIKVRTRDAEKMAVRLAREEGIFAGVSSGAAVAAMVEFNKANKGRTLLAILPDGGEKYLSTGIYGRY